MLGAGYDGSVKGVSGAVTGGGVKSLHVRYTCLTHT